VRGRYLQSTSSDVDGADSGWFSAAEMKLRIVWELHRGCFFSVIMLRYGGLYKTR
jgi:hypothetical protein